MTRPKIAALPVALLATLLPVAGRAAYTCPDASPAAITAPAAGGRKCQAAIAREATKYLATKVKVLSACKLASAAGTCPAAADVDALQKAATTAQQKIAKSCDDDAAQAGLGSSYKAGTDAAVIGSCVLSQQSVAGDLVSAETNGPSTEALPSTGKERVSCVREISRTGGLLAASLVKNADVCLAAHAKQGGDLAAACVGAWQGGA